MKVHCRANSGADLPTAFLDEAAGFGRGARFHVTPGLLYTVYALTTRRGRIWYYICDDRHLNYPVWYPAPLFDVTDRSLSRFWVFAYVSFERDGDAVFAFKEWADDPGGFYDRLSDGDPSAVEVFRDYRRLMELEGSSGSEELSTD